MAKPLYPLGSPFTWTNRQKQSSHTQERLDWCLSNTDWDANFPNPRLCHGDFFGSDHRPLILTLHHPADQSKHVPRFIFDRLWMSEPGFEDCLRDAWTLNNHTHHSNSLTGFNEKLHHSDANMTVSDLLTPTKEWNLALLQATFPEDVSQAILTIPLTNISTPDAYYWSLTPHGTYTVNSDVSLMSNGSAPSAPTYNLQLSVDVAQDTQLNKMGFGMSIQTNKGERPTIEYSLVLVSRKEPKREEKVLRPAAGSGEKAQCQRLLGMEEDDANMVTPGEVLGKASDFKAGKGAYVSPHNHIIYASLTGLRRIQYPPLDAPDQRPTIEVTGHKAHGVVPEPGSIVIGRVTRVMARMASLDIMCVGTKSVPEKFSGIIRQQDVRATEIDKVDMHTSFRVGDIVRAIVLSLGDARAYHLSTAKNELGVVSAESAACATMVPVSWTEMQCPLTGQIEQRKVAKFGG
ncbi:hypothetical protein F8388_026097 [Cannabis sativa]|uniref:S1 motif domain-containing protein n=2 Tax=Cannabis sativa TaxID=3483 RepID=A0A7J6EVE9_CANSA|nr:hypothetical protein G4B88_004176 [Cannabis sativa]KAF4376297.1 hypothetical protein F8388_026097 [Cannabis sativa]